MYTPVQVCDSRRLQSNIGPGGRSYWGSASRGKVWWFDGFNGVVILGGMVVALPEGKKLISTAEAAKILGVTMGRVRQLAALDPEDGGLESWLAAPTARVFDEAAVRKLAKAKRTTGRPKGGFQAN